MAKETLLDPEKRSNYDKWRNCGMAVSYQQWLGVKEHVHQVKLSYHLLMTIYKNINQIHHKKL